MPNGPITRDRLLSTLESMQSRKSQRKDAAWYVAMLKEQKVDFQLTPEDEQKIRLHGRYLGKEGLDNLIAAVRDNYRPDVSQQPKLEQPTFSPSTEKVVFVVGGNSYIIPNEILRKGPVNLVRLDGQDVVVAHVEGNKLYADVTIYGDLNMRAVELKRNKFLIRPPSWDYNSSDRAFEVVNEKGTPIFQLYYKTPSNIVINGVFSGPQIGVMYLSEYGMFGNEPTLYFVKPIFKYPSWKFPGQYDDQPEIDAEKAREQIQKRMKELEEEAEGRRQERMRKAREAEKQNPPPKP